MKTKPKLILCAVIFILGAAVNVFFSTALHNILSGQMKTLAMTGFFEGIRSIAASGQHLRLFLCTQGFTLILAVVFFLTNMRPYQSHLNSVTPEIQTPAAVGQYQHGSAKWLNDNEKDKAFESFVLDPDDAQIAELLRNGYDGLDFMKSCPPPFTAAPGSCAGQQVS
jgi:type IV secretion system protein VirD4